MSALKHLEPHGVDTLMEEEVEFQESLSSLFREKFRRYGYRPVLTPTFEYLDVFRETESLSGDDMVKLIARDGRILVLRPDATVPVSRITARLYKDVPYPLKFSYITSVYRWADPVRGERLETLQAGMECYNNPNPDCDAEVLALGVKGLAEAGIKELHVDIGHAGWLEGLFQESGLERSVWLKVLGAIEERNPGKVQSVLENTEIDPALIETTLEILNLYGEVKPILVQARKWVLNPVMEQALNNLEAVYNAIVAHKPEAKIHMDLGFTNPFQYYTGVIFKGYAPGCGEPLLQGGRYDGLTGQFGANKPACGLGVNISLLSEVLEMMNIKEWNPCATDYLVVYNDANRNDALDLSEKLRDKGFVVESEFCPTGADGRIASATYRNTREILEVTSGWVKVVNLMRGDISRLPQDKFVSGLDTDQVMLSIH